LTARPEQSVRQVGWAPDGRSLVYTADRHGDEYHQIYRIPVQGGEPEALTGDPSVQYTLAGPPVMSPLTGARCRPFSPDGRMLAYAGADRDPAERDVLVRDLRTGEVHRALRGSTGLLAPVSWSPDGRWLLVYRVASSTDNDVLVVPAAGGAPVLVTPHEGDAWHLPGPWTPDGTAFWLLTDAGREYLALVRQAVDGGAPSVVDEPEWDVEEVDAADDGSLLVWTVNVDGCSRLRARDPRSGRSVPVPDLPAGVVSVLRVAPDGGRLAFLLDTPDRPNDLVVVDVGSGALRYLTDSRPPAVLERRREPPDRIRYRSHDGRLIPAYLYRPAGPGPFPVVLSVHGGPHTQERPTYRYSGLYASLLDRGVGVLAPDVRGSTGYGKTYTRLLQRDWGGGELGDLECAVAYLRTLGWVDPTRIGVFGASFGGFAALSCVSRLPDLFAVGVSVVGPSNLITAARGSPPALRAYIASWFGDPDEDAELLRARSPLTYADQIRVPLLIIHGARDQRVTRAESDQIVASLRSRGVAVRYDLYEDEGHQFTKRANELRVRADTADFLVEHLTRARPDGAGGPPA
jgi:dipeptidyl aminopeptidase/acylaminoacyl peptidase